MTAGLKHFCHHEYSERVLGQVQRALNQLAANLFLFAALKVLQDSLHDAAGKLVETHLEKVSFEHLDELTKLLTVN